MDTIENRKSRFQSPADIGSKRRPLYRAITDTLRQQLADGNLAAGTRMPTLRELAKQFSVSTITVRQALRALEQEGRLHCIPGVGTFVRPNLPQMAATQQITVAFVTIEIEGSLPSEIAHSIEQECQQRGWGMQFFNAQGNPHLEARNLSRITKSGANTAIILPVCDSENLEEMVKLKLADFPLVILDRAIPGLKVDVVASDHEKGGYLATEYLIKRGHKQIILVSEPAMSTSIAARIQGYERALVDNGLEPRREQKIWIDTNVHHRGCCEKKKWLGGYEAALNALKNFKPPMAIFAHNSYSGWGAFKACNELGSKVPQDVSIICFDDDEFIKALTPPMTAIAQRTYDIGRLAVEALEHRIAEGGKTEPQQTVVDIDLIERASVLDISNDG